MGKKTRVRPHSKMKYERQFARTRANKEKRIAIQESRKNFKG